jgi:hypothetical protein
MAYMKRKPGKGFEPLCSESADFIEFIYDSRIRKDGSV